MRKQDDPGFGDQRPEGRPREPSRGTGIRGRTVLMIGAALLLVAFAAANFRSVEVSFLLFTTEARVVTVIVVAGALGFLVGYLVGRPSRVQRKLLRRDADD